jgi:hypothetical protein
LAQDFLQGVALLAGRSAGASAAPAQRIHKISLAISWRMPCLSQGFSAPSRTKTMSQSVGGVFLDLSTDLHQAFVQAGRVGQQAVPHG